MTNLKILLLLIAGAVIGQVLSTAHGARAEASRQLPMDPAAYDQIVDDMRTRAGKLRADSGWQLTDDTASALEAVADLAEEVKTLRVEVDLLKVQQ